MTTSVQQRGMTVEDLMAPGMPEKGVELIEGELVEMTPGSWRHGKVSFRFAQVFSTFCQHRPELDFAPDNCGFLISRSPDTLLSPDAALFRRRDLGDTPWYPFAPELVVEVLSPANSPAEMVYKRHRYFDAGTEQVWIVDIDKRELAIHYRDGRILKANAGDVIEGEGIVEGLRVAVGDVVHAA